MNYANFARPESAIGHDCEECGKPCGTTFCSVECEQDAHSVSDFGDDGWQDEDDGQPTEYEEWQDLYGGDDWDHGQYDE